MKAEQIIKMLEAASGDPESKEFRLSFFAELSGLQKNNFHPLVFINGNPQIGSNVYIGLFSEVNARDCDVIIGDNCDIASFVSINVADSHLKTIGLRETIDRKPITLEENVFVGSHSFIGGETYIGHHSVVGAGTILLNGGKIPPYSLIVGNPAIIKKGYFKKS